MEDCTVRAEYCETIFRMVGDKTRAVVDNCDITMRQPDSMAKHDMKKGANPMLARGNDRADGSTVIQNSRITLSGDNGAAHLLSAQRLERKYAGRLPRLRHHQHEGSQRQHHPGPDTA